MSTEFMNIEDSALDNSNNQNPFLNDGFQSTNVVHIQIPPLDLDLENLNKENLNKENLDKENLDDIELPGDIELPVEIPEESKIKEMLDKLMNMSEDQRKTIFSNLSKLNNINPKAKSFTTMSETSYAKYKQKILEQRKKRASKVAYEYQQKKEQEIIEKRKQDKLDAINKELKVVDETNKELEKSNSTEDSPRYQTRLETKRKHLQHNKWRRR